MHKANPNLSGLFPEMPLGCRLRKGSRLKVWLPIPTQQLSSQSHVWRSEDNLQDLALSFHHGVPRNKLRSSRSSKCSHPLNHLFSHKFTFLEKKDVPQFWHKISTVHRQHCHLLAVFLSPTPGGSQLPGHLGLPPAVIRTELKLG